MALLNINVMKFLSTIQRYSKVDLLSYGILRSVEW